MPAGSDTQPRVSAGQKILMRKRNQSVLNTLGNSVAWLAAAKSKKKKEKKIIRIVATIVDKNNRVSIRTKVVADASQQLQTVDKIVNTDNGTGPQQQNGNPGFLGAALGNFVNKNA